MRFSITEESMKNEREREYTDNYLLCLYIQNEENK